MGMNFMKRSSMDMGYTYTADPIPSSFSIRQTFSTNGHTMVEINYPNCTNYEGNKIILFKDTSPEKISAMAEIDPHFREGSNIVARLVPTSDGWNIGKMLLAQL